jgi:hypothetical protein
VIFRWPTTTAHVVRILAPIWSTKTETATRVRGRIEKFWTRPTQVAQVKTLQLKGYLSEVLPNSKVANAGHHAALPWAESAFMQQLRHARRWQSRRRHLVATKPAQVLRRTASFDLMSRPTIPAGHEVAHENAIKTPTTSCHGST